MKRTSLFGILILAAPPLAAQHTAPATPPACGPAAAAPGAPGAPGQCPMMQEGGCPMMQGGHQGHGHGAMQGGAGGTADVVAEPALAPVWEAMTFCPSRLLDQKEVLELTAQQEAKLEDLLESAQRAIEAVQSEARKGSDALARALRQTKPDVKEVERRFGVLHAALGNAHLIRLRTSIQARAVLTGEQREKVIGQLAVAGGCGHPGGQ